MDRLQPNENDTKVHKATENEELETNKKIETMKRKIAKSDDDADYGNTADDDEDDDNNITSQQSDKTRLLHFNHQNRIQTKHRRIHRQYHFKMVLIKLQEQIIANT